MKKILIVEPCYENFGGYIRAFGIAKALSENNFKVDLLISSKRKFDLRIRKKRINQYLFQYSLPRIYLNFFITGRILRGLIASLFVIFKKYDILHFFALIQFESNIPFLIAKLLRKRVIVDWDDYWTDAHLLVSAFNNPIIKNYFRFCEYHLQKYAWGATATSEFLMNELHTLGIKNRLKIINGINKNQFLPTEKSVARQKLNIKHDEKIILVLGNTLFRERTVYLARVFEKINKSDNSIKLYVNKDFRKLIKEQATEEKFNEKIFNNIKNLGFIPDELLGYYVCASDCTLFPMGNSTLEKACFPTRIGTYLNGNLPILTNRTDTEACHTLEKNNCAIIGENLKHLAAEANNFFNDFQKQNAIRNNIIDKKSTFYWENLVSELINFYKKSLKK